MLYVPSEGLSDEPEPTKLAETTPTDGDIVGRSFVIEIAIAAVLEIAVVHPAVGCLIEAEIIPSIAVVSTWANEG